MRACAFSILNLSLVPISYVLRTDSRTAGSSGTVLSVWSKRAYASPMSISGSLIVPNLAKWRSRSLLRVSAIISTAFLAVSMLEGLS